MRSLSRMTGILALSGLISLLGGPVSAEPATKAGIFDALKSGMVFPQTKAWKVGQQATHRLTWDAGQQGTLQLDVRLALTGEEGGAYWYEWNFTNPGGSMGQSIAPYVGGFTLRFLTTQTDDAAWKKAIDGVQKLSPDPVSSMVQRFQFQVMGQPLYEVSFKDLAKQGTAIAVGEMTPDGKPATIPEPSGTFDWRTGKEKVQVPAGIFNDSPFWHADYSDTGGAGNVHINLHDTIPLLPVAKVVANMSGQAVGGANQVKLELISSAETGAQTMTTGQPVPKTADEVIGELFMMIMLGGSTGSQLKLQ
ncbi:MAG: hypothetical protein GEEBNDBF_01081 [bacterium]|nr:hypothetical protein [bacterium]